MKFPAYPKYKDSGVQWLGEVPEGWKVLELRRFIRFITSGSRGWAEYYSDEGKIFVRIGNLTRHSINVDLSDIQHVAPPAGAEGERTVIFKGDVLFSITAYIGSVAVATEQIVGAYVNQHIALVRLFVGKVFPRYIAYATLSDSGQAQLGGQGYGGTKVQLALDDVKSFRVPVPPLSEQTAIANFLDRETGRIDTLVAKKRQLIALLGEKRTALISRTVTRGLPADAARELGLEPHTRFKESGIEWLGKVPEGWEIVPLRHLILALDQGWSPTADSSPATEDQWGVLKLSAIREGSFAPSDNKALDDLPNGIKPLTPNAGDVLISRANTPEKVGDVCLVKGEHPWRIIPDLIYRLQLDRKKVLPVFVVAFLLSRGGRAQIQADARGSNGSMVKLGQSHLRSWRFPLPPHPEQTAIATYLDRETATIDQLVAKVEAAIVRLLEYRTALITAAVTGKIDVRGEGGRTKTNTD